MLTRSIDNSDLWSAIRGIGMHRMTREELIALDAEHKNNPLFASQVISKAALQVLASKPRD